MAIPQNGTTLEPRGNNLFNPDPQSDWPRATSFRVPLLLFLHVVPERGRSFRLQVSPTLTPNKEPTLLRTYCIKKL